MRIHPMAGLAALPLAVALASLAPGVVAAAEEGAITIVLSEEPDMVDPCEASRSNVGRIVKQNVTETLTEIDPDDGSITPRLATAWERIDDLTWRFELQEGVTFHDGEPFNAEAVKTAIERTLDERIDCEIRIKFFGGMKVTPVVVDEHTLDIKTAEPAPILPTMMGTMTITSPNTVMGERTRDPIGTGPYRFVSWTPGTSVVLERFADYWGEAPEVAKVTYVFRGESAVRAAMVAAGEADIAPNIAVQDATDPAMDFSYLNSETSSFRIDVTKPPLDDVRVRKALNLAIDRDAMIGTIFSPDVVKATQMVVPSINGHNPNLEPYPYDPEQAKQLLAEAEADGVPVERRDHDHRPARDLPERHRACRSDHGDAPGRRLQCEAEHARGRRVGRHLHQALRRGPAAAAGPDPARQQQRRRRVHGVLQVPLGRRPVGARRSRARRPDREGDRHDRRRAAEDLAGGVPPGPRGPSSPTS